MKYEFIDSQDSFDTAIAALQDNEIIGLDTEFLRTNTYFPVLSLIQVSNAKKDIFVFDIHSKKIDWSDLIFILINPLVKKIIHSAEQDLESINYRFNIKVSEVVDTQIMADMLDLGRQIGYGNLVEHYFEIKLDKDKQFSAWHKRPLTTKQLEYAAADVFYLIDLYQKMLVNFEEQGKNFEILAERSLAINFKTKNINKSNVNKLTKIFCNKFAVGIEDYEILKNLIYKREILAIKHNKARKNILEDKDIFEILLDKNLATLKQNKYLKISDIIECITR